MAELGHNTDTAMKCILPLDAPSDRIGQRVSKRDFAFVIVVDV
jgi:hypothetical protein